MIVTTIKQSEKLLDLGLAESTADMSHQRVKYDGEDPVYCLSLALPKKGDIPAWTLSALLDILSTYFDVRLHSRGESWGMEIENSKGELKFNGRVNTPLDAAFNTLCWTLEHNFLNSDKEP